MVLAAGTQTVQGTYKHVKRLAQGLTAMAGELLAHISAISPDRPLPEEEQPVIYSDLAFSRHDEVPRPWRLSSLSKSGSAPTSTAALTEEDVAKERAGYDI